MKPTFLDLIWVSGTVPVNIVSIYSLSNSRVVVVISLSVWTTLITSLNWLSNILWNSADGSAKVFPSTTVLLPPSTTTVLVQLSETGSNAIVPSNATTSNGFIFSTLDANAFSIQSVSE